MTANSKPLQEINNDEIKAALSQKKIIKHPDLVEFLLKCSKKGHNARQKNRNWNTTIQRWRTTLDEM